MSKEEMKDIKNMPIQGKADVMCTWINNTDIGCNGCPMNENCKPGHAGFLDLIEVMT